LTVLSYKPVFNVLVFVQEFVFDGRTFIAEVEATVGRQSVKSKRLTDQ